MNDLNTTLIGGAIAIVSVAFGAFLQRRFRKDELKELEAQRAVLAAQNETLQKQHHKDEMQKINELGSGIRDALCKIRGAIEKKE